MVPEKGTFPTNKADCTTFPKPSTILQPKLLGDAGQAVNEKFLPAQ
jgi:hypothetical protein